MVEQHAKRRLTAILVVDVAGYSRLMGADEEGTLATLKGPAKLSSRSEDCCVPRPNGQDDGRRALVEFVSAVDAVRCATRPDGDPARPALSAPDKPSIAVLPFNGRRKAERYQIDRAQNISEAARLARRVVELGKDDAVAL
jgi:hypothetical protein